MLIVPSVQGPGTCTVIARFQEKNLLRLHAGTYVQGTEGEVAAQGRVKQSSVACYSVGLASCLRRRAVATRCHDCGPCHPSCRFAMLRTAVAASTLIAAATCARLRQLRF